MLLIISYWYRIPNKLSNTNPLTKSWAVSSTLEVFPNSEYDKVVSQQTESRNKTTSFLNPSASKPQLLPVFLTWLLNQRLQSRLLRLWSPPSWDPPAKQSLSPAKLQQRAPSAICFCLTFHINVTHRSWNWCWQVICVCGMLFYCCVCVCVCVCVWWLFHCRVLSSSIPLSLMQWVPRPISLWPERLQCCIRPLIILCAFCPCPAR